MSENLENIRLEIDSIKERNTRVEAEKAWETSLFRVISITLATYIIAGIVLVFIGVVRPWTSAFVPAVGYFLSTQSLPFLKRRWIQKYLDAKSRD